VRLHPQSSPAPAPQETPVRARQPFGNENAPTPGDREEPSSSSLQGLTALLTRVAEALEAQTGMLARVMEAQREAQEAQEAERAAVLARIEAAAMALGADLTHHGQPPS
jgi:hypothetical protein